MLLAATARRASGGIEDEHLRTGAKTQVAQDLRLRERRILFAALQSEGRTKFYFWHGKRRQARTARLPCATSPPVCRAHPAVCVPPGCWPHRNACHLPGAATR